MKFWSNRQKRSESPLLIAALIFLWTLSWLVVALSIDPWLAALGPFWGFIDGLSVAWHRLEGRDAFLSTICSFLVVGVVSFPGRRRWWIWFLICWALEFFSITFFRFQGEPFHRRFAEIFFDAPREYMFVLRLVSNLRIEDFQRFLILLIFQLSFAIFIQRFVVWQRYRSRIILLFVLLVIQTGQLFGEPWFSVVSVPWSTVLGFNSITSSSVREKPRLIPQNPRETKNIILVIDESIAGYALGINNPAVSDTPYLNSISLTNFGMAAAVANCSMTSNAILRNGLTDRDLPDVKGRVFKKPTIFDYAIKAGYRSSYVNSQHNALTNLLSVSDVKDVDVHLVAGRECELSGDCGSIEALTELLADDSTPHFILVIKQGTHWPYSENYPDKATLYGPKETKPLFSDTVETVGAYLNAINWTVDRFFEQLIPKISKRDYLLIYTSDHGQYFQWNYPTFPHCAALIDKERVDEGNVPLLVLGTAKTRSLFDEPSKRLYNKASMYQLFPTLLTLMGYSQSEVEKLYGPSFFNTESIRFPRFVMGSFMFKSQMIWQISELRFNPAFMRALPIIQNSEPRPVP